MLAQIWVVPETLKITGARWEVLRDDRGTSLKSVYVPELYGKEAYFGCGKPFRSALAAYPPPAAELFLENASALIQAETFLIRERGYASLEAYVDYWKEFYTGSCRYYSNLDAIKRSWGEYVSARQAGTNLFNRFKTFTLDGYDDGLLLHASMSDSFHEMALALRLDQTGENIHEASGAIVRAPDQVCPDAATFLSRLTGFRLPALGRGQITSLLGGGQGCVHLIEMVCEAAKLLKAETRL
jgi:hypothetical protein